MFQLYYITTGCYVPLVILHDRISSNCFQFHKKQGSALTLEEEEQAILFGKPKSWTSLFLKGTVAPLLVLVY